MTTEKFRVEATDVYGFHIGKIMLKVHAVADCEESTPCPIHAPSDHPLKKATQVWRADRQIMERVCPHGVGHPDPDDRKVRAGNAVHGCCIWGCCRD